MTISIALYCFLYTALALIGGIGIFRYVNKKKSQKKSISLSDVTVIVPFRNEENRIFLLLQSLNQSKELPAALIFIDDHSTDKTVEVIQNQLKIQYQLVASPNQGKKQAIAFGIQEARTSYVLTMDADVWFEPDYFSYLRTLPHSDMHILPVKMNAKGWKKMFELDVYMVNSMSLIASGLRRPIVASGANLLFLKEVYLTVNSLSSHTHIASGDDQFLLADFLKHKKEVQFHNDAVFAVTTEVPATISELVSQRLRWILKSPKIKDTFALKIGVIQLVTTLTFLILGCWALIVAPKAFLVLFGTKTIVDILLVAVYFIKIDKAKFLFLIPFYEIILPIYTVLLAVIAIFYKPQWKGR